MGVFDGGSILERRAFCRYRILSVSLFLLTFHERASEEPSAPSTGASTSIAVRASAPGGGAGRWVTNRASTKRLVCVAGTLSEPGRLDAKIGSASAGCVELGQRKGCVTHANLRVTTLTLVLPCACSVGAMGRDEASVRLRRDICFRVVAYELKLS